MARLAPAVSALARQTMRTAFEDLERTITPADSRNFRGTTLQQVRAAALDIENQLAARQSLRNMRRLTPLLNGLEHYAKVVDILCNGTPYLAWIWAPLTLILRVASEYVEAFEQLMKGYKRIADALGRFEILNDAFVGNADFQHTVAIFYADILQFHKHAYKFVRRNGWRLLFLTSWGRFQRRFETILDDLNRHGNLIDLEANARNIAEAREMRKDLRAWREENIDRVKYDEEEQAAKQYRSIMSWLKIDESDQLKIFESIAEEGSKHPGTCGWILKNQKIKSWLRPKPDTSFIWLQGNPGSGKSVLTTQIVNFIQATKASVICHMCTYSYATSTKYEHIIRSLLLQLLRKNGELVAYVYQECVIGKKTPAISTLEQLLQALFVALADEPRNTECLWIVLDGLDECESGKQARVVSLMDQITSNTKGGTVCKVLISSRPSPMLLKRLRRKQVVSLSDEGGDIEHAIQRYASQRLRFLHERLRQLELEPVDIEEIEGVVAKKADGMFLYARLVLDYLGTNVFFSGEELKESIHLLPETLSEFYRKILMQILTHLDARSVDRIKSMLGWIAFAKRPLKKPEFLSALSFSAGNPNIIRLTPQYILDICSPLVEERRDSTLSFIHVSVKEFLQKNSDGWFIDEKNAYREHGVATVSCLLSGLKIFNEDCDEQTRYLRLVKGIHGFHVYATEYWTDYLLDEAVGTSPIDTSSSLFALASQLAHTLNKTYAPLQPTNTNALLDERMKALQQHEIIYRLVEHALKARSRKRLESELLQDYRPNGVDRSLQKPFVLDGVSTMLISYQKSVEYLLNQDSCPGASAEELELFKSHFRTSAFTCRLRQCPRATVGFETEQLRREHEITHAGGFRCTVPSCQYPPYRSAQSLKAHVDRYHSTTPAQKSIRRVERVKSINRITSLARSASGETNKRKRTEINEVTGNIGQSGALNHRYSKECIACVRRMIRCDGRLPTCGNCRRLNLACFYFDDRDSADNYNGIVVSSAPGYSTSKSGAGNQNADRQLRVGSNAEGDMLHISRLGQPSDLKTQADSQGRNSPSYNEHIMSEDTTTGAGYKVVPAPESMNIWLPPIVASPPSPDMTWIGFRELMDQDLIHEVPESLSNATLLEHRDHRYQPSQQERGYTTQQHSYTPLRGTEHSEYTPPHVSPSHDFHPIYGQHQQQEEPRFRKTSLSRVGDSPPPTGIQQAGGAQYMTQVYQKHHQELLELERKNEARLEEARSTEARLVKEARLVEASLDQLLADMQGMDGVPMNQRNTWQQQQRPQGDGGSSAPYAASAFSQHVDRSHVLHNNFPMRADNMQIPRHDNMFLFGGDSDAEEDEGIE